MARYDNTKLKKNKDNKKRYYTTTIYDKVPERNDDMYFIAQEGDRCDNLAFRFYGNPEFWWFIARVNNLKTMNIPAGTSLRIPVSLDNAKGF
jgi:nucleoid-associated protein YgaU